MSPFLPSERGPLLALTSGERLGRESLHGILKFISPTAAGETSGPVPREGLLLLAAICLPSVFQPSGFAFIWRERP